MSSSSSNLHSLLKNQIREAIAHLYNEQGTSAANRYSTPDEFSKALLDVLFPTEVVDNTTVTGVVQVPTVEDSKSDSESTDSKKERKKRAPMTEEAKAVMKAKREATLASKKVVEAPAPAPVPEPVDDKKERKPRAPMSDEAKAAMKAKREATLAAKKAAVA